MKKRRHSLVLESLECRQLLAADPFGTNSLQPLDVSRDGVVSPLDALQIINALGRSERGTADPSQSIGTFIDVNQDGVGTAIDALDIINRLSIPTPLLAAKLASDSAPIASEAFQFDLQSNDYAIDLFVALGDLGSQRVQFRIGDAPALHDITDLFVDNKASLTKEQIDSFFGSTLPDGEHKIHVEFANSIAPPVEFTLTVDRAKPELLAVSPQRSVLVGDRSIQVKMSTPVDELFLDPESISLVDDSDASRQFNPTSITTDATSGTLRFEFDNDIPAGDYQLNVDENRISTPTGNAVGDQIRSIPLRYLTPTAIWNNPAGGNWSDAENWQSGEVPTETDTVLIDVPEGIVVQGPFGNLVTVEHLTLRGELDSPSNIQANTISVDRGVLRINGAGVSSDVLYTSRTGLGRIDAVRMNVENAIINLPIAIETQGSLRVTGGLELNDTMTIRGTANPFPASVTFIDGQDVTGRGEFVLAGDGDRTSVIEAQGAGFVKIANSLTIHGSQGMIRGDSNLDLEARVIDDGGDDAGKILLSGLGSDDDVLNLNLNTSISRVEIDTLKDITVRNQGTAPLQFKDANDPLERVILNSPVLVTARLAVEDHVTFNADVSIRSVDGAIARIDLLSGVVVDGNANIIFDGEPTDQQRIETGIGSVPTLRETVSIGSGITIRGNQGWLRTNSGVGFDFAGTIVGGPDSNIILQDVGSVAGLTIDSPTGSVKLMDIKPMKITGVGDSFVRISDSQEWRSMELLVNVRIDAGASLKLTNGITVGGQFRLEGSDEDRAILELDDDASVTGDGEIVFAGTATRPYGNLFQADLRGATLDPRIEVRGQNGIFAGSVRYNGTITATDGGTIAAGGLKGGGQPIVINSTDGKVLMFEAEDIVIDGVGDSELIFEQFAQLGHAATEISELGLARLTHVTLNLPTSVRGTVLVVEKELTVNTTVTLLSTTDDTNPNDIVYRNSHIQLHDTPQSQQVHLGGSGSVLFGESTVKRDRSFSPHRISGIIGENIATVGPDITLGGKSGSLEWMTHQGSIETEPGAYVELSDVISSPGVLHLEPQAGRVLINSVPEGTSITGFEGAVAYAKGLGLVDSTVSIPLFVQGVDGDESNTSIIVQGDLILNSTITLVGPNSRLHFYDNEPEQLSHLHGNGTVVMSRFDPDPNDGISVAGHAISASDSLTIGSGITIRAGKGTISVGPREELRIHGTIVDLHGQLTIGPLADD